MERKQAPQANQLEQAAEGKASHGTTEHTGALTDESRPWGMYRISEPSKFVFYTEFHMIPLTE